MKPNLTAMRAGKASIRAKDTTRSNMPAADRVALIKRVLDRAYDETEVWYDSGFGAQLAYLALAIADGEPDSFVDWSEDICGMDDIRAKFRAWFQPSDPVWLFIYTGGKEGITL
jgi:hypothetical protein